MKTKIIIMFLTLIMASAFLSPEPTGLTAVRIQQGPVINGYLDDEAWKQALPFSEFKVVEPDTGSDSVDKTELRVIYDENNLYIGVFCFSANPSKITVTELQHDGEDDGSDLVRVLLDPFQDKRNAYVFFVNARGARTDGLATGEHYSNNWDGVWEAKSRIRKNGWSCEIRIPFKSISFKPGLTEWGFNLERFIPSRMETIRLSGISMDAHFYNPAEATLLQGISGIKQGLGLMTYIQYDSISENIGANIRLIWRISPGNTLYLVYNKGWSTEYDTLTGFSTGRFLSLQERGVFKIQLTWRP